MQYKPGMFADWNDMIQTVTTWVVVVFCASWLLVIGAALVWDLT